LKTAYKKEPVFSYAKTIFTAQSDQFGETLNNGFIKKAIISNEIREKDLDLFKDGTNTALTLGASKCADVVIFGDNELGKEITEEIKPSRYKKVVKNEDIWKDDVTQLLDLYKSLTDS
jgi:starch synthase